MKRYHLVMLVGVVVLHVLAWLFYGGRTPIVSPEVPGNRQLERIEEFKQQTAEYDSFNKAAAGLSEPVKAGGHDLMLAVRMQSNDPIPEMQFAQILADRRVSRLFGYLKAMKPEVAAKKAEQLCHEKHEFQASEFRRDLEFQKKYGIIIITKENIEEMRKKHKDRPKVQFNFREDQHASCVSLFLCAHFCEPSVTLRVLDQWVALIKDTIALAEGDPEVELWLTIKKRNNTQEPLFYVNLYVHILRTHGGHSPQEISQAIGGKPLPPHASTPLCAWDASANPFDFNHIHQFAPVDTHNQQLSVPLFRTWGHEYWETANQQSLIQALRQLIETRIPRKS